MPAKNHPLLPPGWTAPLLSANAMAYYQGKTDVQTSNNYRAVGSAHAILIIKPALPLSADPLAQKVLALSRLRGVGAASRGTATLGAAAVLPYRAESFGVFVPDDDSKEPERAKDCPEYVKAEECRAAGCEWTKKGAECAHWALKNTNKGKPTPPKVPETLAPSQNPETLSPTTLAPTAKPTKPAPTAKPTVKPSPPTTTTTTLPPTPSPTKAPTSQDPATTTTKTFETTTTTKAEEVNVASTTAANEEASTSTTAEQTTTSTTTEQATTTTTCFIPEAANYSSGCIVDTCKSGFKPNGNGTACDPDEQIIVTKVWSIAMDGIQADDFNDNPVLRTAFRKTIAKTVQSPETCQGGVGDWDTCTSDPIATVFTGRRRRLLTISASEITFEIISSFDLPEKSKFDSFFDAVDDAVDDTFTQLAKAFVETNSFIKSLKEIAAAESQDAAESLATAAVKKEVTRNALKVFKATKASMQKNLLFKIESGTCASSWTAVADGEGCEVTQYGCPSSACDGDSDGPWCMAENSHGWFYCTPSMDATTTQPAPPTPGPGPACTSDDHCETGHVCHEEKCAAICSAGWRAAKGWRECKDGCQALVDSSFTANLTAWFALSKLPDNTTCAHISNWDVSKITDMGAAFKDRADFDEDISCWDTSKVTTFNREEGINSSYGMFEKADSFNQPIGCWDVGSATTMKYMFYRMTGASDFNQDVSNWNVAKVTDMNAMFYGATSFNQDVSNWNVSSVTDMKYMFVDAKSFNQNLSKWDVPNLAENGGCDFAGGAACGPTCSFSGYKLCN